MKSWEAFLTTHYIPYQFKPKGSISIPTDDDLWIIICPHEILWWDNDVLQAPISVKNQKKAQGRLLELCDMLLGEPLTELRQSLTDLDIPHVYKNREILIPTDDNPWIIINNKTLKVLRKVKIPKVPRCMPPSLHMFINPRDQILANRVLSIYKDEQIKHEQIELAAELEKKLDPAMRTAEEVIAQAYAGFDIKVMWNQYDLHYLVGNFVIQAVPPSCPAASHTVFLKPKKSQVTMSFDDDVEVPVSFIQAVLGASPALVEAYKTAYKDLKE